MVRSVYLGEEVFLLVVLFGRVAEHKARKQPSQRRVVHILDGADTHAGGGGEVLVDEAEQGRVGRAGRLSIVAAQLVVLEEL